MGMEPGLRDDLSKRAVGEFLLVIAHDDRLAGCGGTSDQTLPGARMQLRHRLRNPAAYGMDRERVGLALAQGQGTDLGVEQVPRSIDDEPQRRFEIDLRADLLSHIV